MVYPLLKRDFPEMTSAERSKIEYAAFCQTIRNSNSLAEGSKALQ